MRKCPPAASTGSVVQMAFRVSRFSSARRPRSLHGTPTASYSSGDQPVPKPTRSRPFERTSIAVSVRASSVGLYQGRISTLVPTAIRLVCAAT